MKYESKKEILCVIPARMGSTRLEYKNLRELEKNFSLIDQALATSRGFQTCISTDKPELLNKKDELIIKRPSAISDSVSNVSTAVAHATLEAEKILKRKFKFIITLMPAIACRSNNILKDMLRKFIDQDSCMSSFTVAETHPWIWKVFDNNEIAQNSWTPNKQKNSQNLPKYFVEHASIIINKREVIEPHTKWKYPLMLYSLPSWAVALDIDTEEDLKHSRIIYPAIKDLLNDWRGNVYFINKSKNISPD